MRQARVCYGAIGLGRDPQKLESKDTGHDKRDASNAGGTDRLAEEKNTQNSRADRADPRPDGIGGSNRKMP